MNSRKMAGIYAPYIKQFIALKRNLGFKYLNEEIILSYFDRFTVKIGVSELGISKELSDDWCAKRPEESDRYRNMRCSVFKLFAEYLNTIGIRSYMPHIINRKQDHVFVPYIYTKDEISAIFQATDEIGNKYHRKDSVIFALPCLFRLIYATGLRIREATTLKDKDVNLIDNFIRVCDSKNGTERIIPISESLSNVCKEYLEYRSKLPIRARTPENTFFVSLNGNDLIYMSVGIYFRKILSIAGIPYIGKQKGPRIHDLRHTFACHALRSMVECGVDLYYSLPILSTYLGHRTLESTEQYVRLTAEIYPDLVKNMESFNTNVFPEIYDHE